MDMNEQMIEKLLEDLRDNDAAMRALYADKVAELEMKKRGENTLKEYETLASLQGVGTKKEHGTNADSRKHFRLKWLHSNPEYVGALADINEADLRLIALGEELSYRTKQLTALEVQTELLRQKSQRQSIESAVAGL